MTISLRPVKKILVSDLLGRLAQCGILELVSADDINTSVKYITNDVGYSRVTIDEDGYVDRLEVHEPKDFGEILLALGKSIPCELEVTFQ